MHLHEKDGWTNFRIDYERICPLISAVRHHQGRILALFAASGLVVSSKAQVEVLVEEVTKSSEIEGATFDPEHVRSSLCRRLGFDFADNGKCVPRDVDGAVSVVLDTVMKAKDALTEDRLFGWHAALFPTGYSDDEFNARQRKVLNMLFDGFDGNLTSGKWAKICKVSSDTALNDISDLVERGILEKSSYGGRSTNYVLGVGK